MATPERGQSRSGLDGPVQPGKVDLALRRERITHGLEVHGRTIERVVSGVKAMFPADVRVVTRTFDPRDIENPDIRAHFPSSNFQQVIVFGGQSVTGELARTQDHPHFVTDETPGIPRLAVSLTPELGQGYPDVYSKGSTGRLALDVRASVPIIDAFTEKTATEAGLLVVRMPKATTVGARINEGEDPADVDHKIETLLGILGPNYDNPDSHRRLAKELELASFTPPSESA